MYDIEQNKIVTFHNSLISNVQKNRSIIIELSQSKMFQCIFFKFNFFFSGINNLTPLWIHQKLFSTFSVRYQTKSDKIL